MQQNRCLIFRSHLVTRIWKVPPPLVQDLSIIELIREIPKTETFLIQSLTKLVRQFEFEQLIDLAKPLIGND